MNAASASITFLFLVAEKGSLITWAWIRKFFEEEIFLKNLAEIYTTATILENIKFTVRESLVLQKEWLKGKGLKIAEAL